MSVDTLHKGDTEDDDDDDVDDDNNGNKNIRYCWSLPNINLLKTKRNLLYIRNQPVPRCKHFPPRL